MKPKKIPKRKQCHYCGKWYVPDPRTAKFRTACQKSSCRKKRKKQAQAAWLKKNPRYFCSHYYKTKLWLAKHPDYQRNYRRAHREYAAKDNKLRAIRRRFKHYKIADIQDALFIGEIKQIRNIKGADIQDTITRKIDGILNIMPIRSAPIYKTLWNVSRRQAKLLI